MPDVISSFLHRYEQHQNKDGGSLLAGSSQVAALDTTSPYRYSKGHNHHRRHHVLGSAVESDEEEDEAPTKIQINYRGAKYTMTLEKSERDKSTSKSFSSSYNIPYYRKNKGVGARSNVS